MKMCVALFRLVKLAVHQDDELHELLGGGGIA